MNKCYVITHKDVYIPESQILFPINPDKAEGNNIAEKLGYSELRAQYLIWKNESFDASRYGLFQFRRYLDLSSGIVVNLKSETRPLPYMIEKYPSAEKYTDDIIKLSSDFDVIAPIREYTGLSVWKRYAMSSGHKIEDLKLIYEIISKKYPDYLASADEYLSGKNEYYGNLYIMRKQVFNRYCTWVFDILGEYDLHATSILPRTQGYLAERLFGIWFLKSYSDSSLRCAEAPRIHFWGYDDATHHLQREKYINLIFPPGTRRRASVRSFVKSRKVKT